MNPIEGVMAGRIAGCLQVGSVVRPGGPNLLVESTGSDSKPIEPIGRKSLIRKCFSAVSRRFAKTKPIGADPWLFRM